MRRVLPALVLVSALLSVPDSVESQGFITLSVVDLDINTVTYFTVTSVNEDGFFAGWVQASITSAQSSDITVAVTVGGSGSTATRGTSCVATSFFPAVAFSNCGEDYGVYTGSGLNTNNSMNVTISAGSTSGVHGIWISATPDKITENNEIIRISGITQTPGFTTSSTDFTINDADRTVRFSS